MCRSRRPLPTAAVQLLLACFFFALLLLLPSQGNAFTCGYGQRTESKVEYEGTPQRVCEPDHIACFLASCSSGAAAVVTKNHTLPEEWTCDCTFGELGESVDLAPPDLPTTTTTKAPPVPTTTTTTTTTKRSRTTKSGGGKKSGGGRLIVKTHLVLTLQMFIGIMPAVFVGLRS